MVFVLLEPTSTEGGINMPVPLIVSPKIFPSNCKFLPDSALPTMNMAGPPRTMISLAEDVSDEPVPVPCVEIAPGFAGMTKLMVDVAA